MKIELSLTEASVELDQVDPEFKDKREEFEQFFKHININNDLSRSNDGGYANRYTEMAWASFKHGMIRTRAILQREFTHTLQTVRKAMKTKSERPAKVYKSTKRDGSFFIGGYDNSSEEKILTLNKRPKFHKDIKVAEEEAQRLANINDGNYWIFGNTGTKYTKQPDAKIIYVVKGFLDQIEKQTYTASFDWKKEADTEKCNPNLVYIEFEDKESAIYLYSKMTELGLQRFKNWH